jgi:hypothetical protein
MCSGHRSGAGALVVFGFCLTGALAGCATVQTGGTTRHVPKGHAYRWSFDDAQPPSAGHGHQSWWSGEARRKFHGVLGDWSIEGDAAAPSAPNVYRQDARHGATEAPRVLVGDLTFDDHVVRVKCRTESGAGACGLLFHAEDANEYMSAEVDGTGTLRVLHVKDGAPHEAASAHVGIDPWSWHTLEVETRGAWVVVRWDGAKVAEAYEPERTSGKIGLSTRGDGVGSFDDLEVRAD